MQYPLFDIFEIFFWN